MAQLPLSLKLAPVYSEDNFFVSDCNRKAHERIMDWPDWPAHALLLYGSKGGGKTHLAHIWTQRARARIWPASGLDTLMYPLTSAIVIENIERTREEKLLLHLLNYTREQGFGLLLTSNVRLPHLPLTLPDLTSRLRTLNTVAIEHPDDAVLAGVMRKQFADRQLKVADNVIDYIVPRMERSLVRVRELVEAVDQSALAEKKNVTVPFIKKLLDKETEE